MDSLAEVIEILNGPPDGGGGAALATVVETSGSTYRKAGARMLIREDGGAVGVVSGGCVEGEVLERAREVLGAGVPRVCTYDATAPGEAVWGLGLGCKGIVRVLIEPAEDPRVKQSAAFLARCRETRNQGVLATVFEVEGGAPVRPGDRLMVADGGSPEAAFADGDALAGEMAREASLFFGDGRSAARSFERDGWKARVLFERVVPPVALFIYGAGPDVLPLTCLARRLGWHVTVADSRSDFARWDNFPDADQVLAVHPSELAGRLRLDGRSAAVLMSHRYMEDLEVLALLLPTAVPYIGLLGPRARQDKLVADLPSRGVHPDDRSLARLHGPAGLDLGGESPEAIALSVAAEIQCVINGRDGGFLRERTAPLHA